MSAQQSQEELKEDMKDQAILDEQLAYYRARAPEYDEWFMRTGRYDRGPEHRAEWFREVAKIEAALEPLIKNKDVLELACGTGRWTKHLARVSAHTLAVDAAPEAIEVNRNQFGRSNVEYCVADLFSWAPPRKFEGGLFFVLAFAHTTLAVRRFLAHGPASSKTRRFGFLYRQPL